MEGEHAAASAAAAHAGQPAPQPSLHHQQHVALKRLREGIAELSALREQGQPAAKRQELPRPGSGDGSGDRSGEGSGPGASVMLLDVPPGGRTTSLLLPSQPPNSSSGGGQPPLPPGHKPRPVSHEPTGTHVAPPGSGGGTAAGPAAGSAPGSGGSDDGQGPAPGGATAAGGNGSGMHHAASLESLVPSSGPAIAQMDAEQPPEPEPLLDHPEPAPSSRLGTLKRDRSPSPSNGARVAVVGCPALPRCRVGRWVRCTGARSRRACCARLAPGACHRPAPVSPLHPLQAP